LAFHLRVYDGGNDKKVDAKCRFLSDDIFCRQLFKSNGTAMKEEKNLIRAKRILERLEISFEFSSA